MMNVKGVSAAIVVGFALMLCADPAWSLGFGRPSSRAVLGETLNVSVPVRLEAGEEIGPDCVAADVYFGDDKLSQSAVAVNVAPGAGGDRVVRVTTTALVNEPVVTVYLAAGCKAKMTRKFVAFADPPEMANLASASSVPSDMPPGAPRTRTAPAAALPSMASVQASAPGSQGGPSRRGAQRSTTDAPVARAEATVPRPGRGARGGGEGTGAAAGHRTVAGMEAPARTTLPDARIATPSPEPRARLELDPAVTDSLVAPSLLMSSSLSGLAPDPNAPGVRERRAAAAALWAAMNASPEQLARDRQRVQELEQRLAQLQQTSSGAQARVADMEARLRRADSQGSPAVVYGLGALCLVLAGALWWMWRRQREQSAAVASSWWEGESAQDAPADDPALAVDEPALARTSAEFMPVRSPAPADAVAAGGKVGAVAATSGPAATAHAGEPAASLAASVEVPSTGAAVSPAEQPVLPVVQRPPARSVLPKLDVHEAVREITVEELIDLEQQAEFFVVLGQDDAAIELLESHVQTTAGASPLPYLKLLEIYQRLGRRDDYERVRLAFNGRFNAYAPDWESDLQQGHALEDYPGVIERLQSLWSVPGKAMEVLQVSLTRADDSEETFDLPAYRELLFLYAVARDLSEREAQQRTPVDLLLPVHGASAHDDDDDPLTTSRASLQPLMATRPVKALPEASPSLSLDLSLDDPLPAPDDGGAGSGREASGGDQGAAGSSSHNRNDDNSIEFEPLDVPGHKR